MLTSRLLSACSLVVVVASVLLAGRPAAAAEKFPAPVVDVILKGWGDVPWGATLAEFKAKQPKAKLNKDGRWTTGAAEDLAGVKVTAEYVFNKDGKLKLVMFQPPEDGKRTLRESLVAAGALREGPKPNWQRDGVSFILAEVDGDQIVVAVSHRFADVPATKPATKPATPRPAK